MKTYKNLRTEQVAELIATDENGTATLRIAETGEEKEVKWASFKRWWKEVPAIVTVEESGTPEDDKTAEAAPKKAVKEKKVKTFVLPFDPEFIRSYAEALGTEVFDVKVRNFQTLKYNGHMYMAFGWSKNGITLWLRKEAVAPLLKLGAYKTANHMFDIRVTFKDETLENMKEVKDLMYASFHYQFTKEQAKLEKMEKPAKKKQAKAEDQGEHHEEQ